MGHIRVSSLYSNIAHLMYLQYDFYLNEERVLYYLCKLFLFRIRRFFVTYAFFQCIFWNRFSVFCFDKQVGNESLTNYIFYRIYVEKLDQHRNIFWTFYICAVFCDCPVLGWDWKWERIPGHVNTAAFSWQMEVSMIEKQQMS